MNHRRFVRALSLLIVAMFGVVALARAQDVSYNAMPNTDFSKYKTYRWGEVQQSSKPDQITDQMLRKAIDDELAKKGLTKAAGDTADLVIVYQVAVDQQSEWTAYNTGGAGWGYGGMGYYGGGGMGMTTTTETKIAVGQLDFDIYDAAKKQLVWRGMATKTLDPKAKPEKRQNNINKAVTKLLKNYPPPVKKK